jgi:methylated-DNA-[protein]-cysteine S-methyltransferase
MVASVSARRQYCSRIFFASDADEMQSYCLFDTAIGSCGIAWSAQGLTRLQLPELDRSATEKRLRATAANHRSHDPPPAVAQVIADIRRYLAGERVDFSTVAIDLSGVDLFRCSVYQAARSGGWGRTSTYGELARQAGHPGAAREVGQAMARNPIVIIIPCHRILAAGNRLGGFSAYQGTFAKERLLALEGTSTGQLPLMSPARRLG